MKTHTLNHLERALVGAALLHVNEVLELKRRGLHPDHLESAQLREVLRALYALEPAGLMETATETGEVLLDHLSERGVNVSPYDLYAIADGAAFPGAHLERIYRAWEDLKRSRDRVRALEDATRKARRGDLSAEDLQRIIGGGDE